MSDTFSATPNNLQINIEGVDGNTYTYQYNCINGTWSIYGIIDSQNDVEILPSSPNYVKPSINYTITGGDLEGNITDNCITPPAPEPEDDLDFPRTNIELDSFYTVGVPWGGGDTYYSVNNFEIYYKDVCNLNHIYDPNSYYITRLNYQSVSDYDPYKFTGEPVVQSAAAEHGLMTGVGTAINITNETDNNINKVIYNYSENIYYSKFYKLYPNLALEYTDVSGNESLYLYTGKTTLIHKCYVDWKTHYNNITSSIKNWNNSTNTKYKNLLHVTNDGYVTSSSDIGKSILTILFGMNDSRQYNFDTAVLYFAKVNKKPNDMSGNYKVTFTNITDDWWNKALSTWWNNLTDYNNISYNDKARGILLEENFLKIIDLFSGTINGDTVITSKCKLNTTSTDETITILNDPMNDISDRTNVTLNYLFDQFINQGTKNSVISGMSSVYNNLSCDVFSLGQFTGGNNYGSSQKLSSNYLFGGVSDGGANEFTNLIDSRNTQVRIDVDVDFYIIQRQANIIDGTDELIYKYTVDKYNKKLPLYINIRSDEEIGQTGEGKFYRAFIDYPLVDRNTAGSNPQYSSYYSSGSAYTVLREGEYKNKFYAGTMFSIMEERNRRVQGSDNINYTYYNYALNKKANCSCQGATCGRINADSWVDIQNS